VREGTYSDELKAQVADAWETQQTVGPTHALMAEFGSQKERDLWLRVAQAYGKTQDLFVSKARSVVTEGNVLAFTVQVESVRQAKIAERKAKAEEIKARKAAGEVIKRGGKSS
jgi:hypothetical protein